MPQHFIYNQAESVVLDLREENDASVCHGEGQAQNPTTHDGIAQIKDRHAEGSVARKLCEDNTA